MASAWERQSGELVQEGFIVSGVLWSVAVICGVMLLADLWYRWFASRRIQKVIENVPTFAAVPTPQLSDCPTLDIEVETEPAVRLQACLHAPRDGRDIDEAKALVIFCPELNGSHWTALHYCAALLDAGYAVLAFDFRCQGTSQHLDHYTPIHWVTEYELQDITAVLNHVKSDAQLSSLPLGIFGVSRGGSAALIAASRFPQIQSVFTDSAYTTMSLIRHFMYKFSRFVVPDWFFSRLPAWHIELDLKATLRRSEKALNRTYIQLEREARVLQQRPVPIQLVSGSRDSYVTPEVTQQVADAMGDSACVRIFDRAKHNKSRDRHPEEYDQILVNHFDATLVADSEKIRRAA